LLHVATRTGNLLAVRALLATGAGQRAAWVADHEGRLPLFHATTCALLHEFRDLAPLQYAHRDAEGRSVLGTLLAANAHDAALALLDDAIPPPARMVECHHACDSQWVALDLLATTHDPTAFRANHLAFDPFAVDVHGVSLLAAVLGEGWDRRVERLLRRATRSVASSTFRAEDAFRWHARMPTIEWSVVRTGLAAICRAGYQLTDADRDAAREVGCLLWDRESEVWARGGEGRGVCV
jgi:hypothetical protein